VVFSHGQAKESKKAARILQAAFFVLKIWMSLRLIFEKMKGKPLIIKY
jgi:hypothetical protein